MSSDNHLALFAQVEVSTDRALIADTNNGPSLAAVADNVSVNNLSLRVSLLLQNFSEKLFKVLGAVLFELAFDDLVNIFRLIRALFIDFLHFLLLCLLISLLFDFRDDFGEEFLGQFSFAASFVNFLGCNLQRVQRSKNRMG